MKYTRQKRILLQGLIFALFIFQYAQAQYDPSRYTFDKHAVDVLYWHEERGGQHYYYYHLFNNSSTESIHLFYVGFDWKDGLPKLFAPRADTTHIPLKFYSPENWAGQVEYTEETHFYNLYWENTSTDSNVANIPPGESNYQFGVRLSNQRMDHINTTISILFSDGTVTTKRLTEQETEPPPKGHSLVPIYMLLLSQGIRANFIGTDKKS